MKSIQKRSDSKLLLHVVYVKYLEKKNLNINESPLFTIKIDSFKTFPSFLNSQNLFLPERHPILTPINKITDFSLS